MTRPACSSKRARKRCAWQISTSFSSASYVRATSETPTRPKNVFTPVRSEVCESILWVLNWSIVGVDTVCYGCIRGYYLYHPKSSSCPTCNVNLGAKPLAKILPDPAMKELATKLLPDYTVKEEAEERTYYKKFGIKRKQSDTPSDTQPSPPKIHRSLGPSPGNMIRFELYPQREFVTIYYQTISEFGILKLSLVLCCSPDVPLFLSLDKLDAPYMYTQSLLKIMYLRKYLAKKLKVAKPEEIEILCKGTVVGPEYSLEFIRRTRWKESSKMVLEYRRQLIAS
ncbi:hypothetical protein F444_06005 [Phytophthora nicotianae P1976]|uniref:RAWUL domain-containing protein n=1 Tax=Phytophthora nicotianae P1976 TaxID=1317066 RepID=A0A081AK54_PHYNI|nr:hypothetical protein F444_06005 [Phytophthora nicotianae P1976]